MTRQPVVLVGVDGSDASLGAIEWAVALAQRAGWGLHLVCAYATPSFTATTLDGGYAAVDDSQLEAGAREVLAAAEARVGGRVPVTGDLRSGDATSVLVEMSRNAGLLVIGTRRGRGVADRILGAVSAALPPHAHCPTVVVPAPVGEPTMPIRKIVVGVDGSDVARTALRRALVAAKRWGAELTAFAAIPPTAATGAMTWVPVSVDHDQLMADTQAGLDAAIAEALGEVGFERDEVDVRGIALDGAPAALLTEFSTAVDLVVVGTRGRGGFVGLLLGSTSQTVIQHSQCPVLVVPGGHDEDAVFGGSFPWQES